MRRRRTLVFDGGWTTVPAVSLLRTIRTRSAGVRVATIVSREANVLIMNANLIAAASEVIPSTELLVNMVSRRVRQLTFGHRPLVAVPPGMLAADIALTEIIDRKLTSEPAVGPDKAEADVVLFPGTLKSGKKAA
jgi:DNA-directed RNA polymerase subunit omega